LFINPLIYNYNLIVIYSLVSSILKKRKRIGEINNP